MRGLVIYLYNEIIILTPLIVHLISLNNALPDNPEYALLRELCVLNALEHDFLRVLIGVVQRAPEQDEAVSVSEVEFRLLKLQIAQTVGLFIDSVVLRGRPLRAHVVHSNGRLVWDESPLRYFAV